MANTTAADLQTAPSNNDNTTATSNSSTGDEASRNPCPTPTPDRNLITNTTNNDTMRYFDIDYASTTFEESMKDKSAISLHHYLNGFKELMK